MTGLKIAWTTVGDIDSAKDLATKLVSEGLSACVQIEGPITSYYTWEEKLQTNQEYRLMIKFYDKGTTDLYTWVKDHHAYDVPEWTVIDVDEAGAEYLNWTQEVANKI